MREDIELSTIQPESPQSPPRSEDKDGGQSEEGSHPESPKSPRSTNETREDSVSLPREIAFIAIICMSQLMTQASLAQAIVPLHIIGSTFNTTNAGQLSWFPAAYSLTVGTFILPAGRLGDLFGHKLFYVLGFIWYGVWTLLAGFSVYVGEDRNGMIFFDVCRAMQGIGPAFVLPNSIALLGRRYENGRRKEMVFSIFGATAPGGFVIGGVFAGLFAQFVWWPWTFWVGGIIGLLCAVLGYFIIPSEPRSQSASDSNGNGKSRESIWQRMDAAGAAAGTAGLVLINFAWNQAPIVGWSTPYIYVLLIIGFLSLLIFAYIESRATHPLIPREVLTKDTSFILGCIAFGWATFGIWTYYLWQILEVLQGVTPLLGLARFSPVSVSGLVAAITTGFMLHKLGPGVVMCGAMCAFLAGSILIATLPIGQIYWEQVFIAVIITPWGMDMSFPAANIVLSDKASKEHQGVAASLVNTVLNYSISLGLGFAGTIETYLTSGKGDGDAEVLYGYRSALWSGAGLSGMGVVCAVAYIISSHFENKKARRSGREEREVESENDEGGKESV